MIRLNVAGVVCQENQVLLIEYDDENGIHYNLPGGGVEENESLHEALIREMREETGAEVNAGELLLVWEYIPQKENNRYGKVHKVGLIYRCELKPGSVIRADYRYDEHQTGVCWKPLSDLPRLETVSFFGERLLTALSNGHFK